MKKGSVNNLLSAKQNGGRLLFNEDITQIISNATISKLGKKGRDTLRVIRFHPRRNRSEN